MNKIIIRDSTGGLGAAIHYDRRVWFETRVPCAYGPDTAAYAALRYIRHCPALRDRLIRQAVRLGLGSGRAAKPVSCRVRTGAAALSLPGESAWIYLRVSQGTIRIRGVRLTG